MLSSFTQSEQTSGQFKNSIKDYPYRASAAMKKSTRIIYSVCMLVILLSIVRTAWLFCVPQIQFDPYSVTVKDTADRPEFLPFQASVINRGLRSVKVNRIANDCSCVNVLLSPRTIPPFGRATLTGKIFLGKLLEGETRVRIAIFANTLVKKPFILKVSATREFHEGLIVLPDSIIVEGRSGERFHRTFNAIASGSTNALFISSDLHDLNCRVLRSKPRQPTDARWLVLDIEGTIPEFSFGTNKTTGSLTLKTNINGRNLESRVAITFSSIS